MVNCGELMSSIFRKKTVEKDVLTTPLKRCLNLWDLTLFGIGHMAGAGIYVVTGDVARNIAGPAVTLSYIIASIVAFLSALCYSEFGALLPKAGSSYSYVYVVMGELPAFIVGWNMFMETLLTIAAVAKAASGVVDSMTNSTISIFIIQNVGSFNQEWMSPYPDFMASAFVLILAVFVIAGAKITGVLNSLLTVINLSILIVIAGVGLYFADIANWKIKSHGGYFPFGVSGVFSGASKCFIAYLGFEAIAMAGEETLNPSRNLPLATLISLFVVTIFYFAASASLTLMVPYYKVSELAPFSHALIMHHSTWATHLVSIGSFVGLTASLVGVIYSTSRLIYALALDGLIFKVFSKVNTATRTPIYSIIMNTILGAFCAFFFNLNTLIELLSIGVFLAFSMLNISLILLRYLPADQCPFPIKKDITTTNNDGVSDSENLIKSTKKIEDIGKQKKCFESLALLKRIPVSNIPSTSITLIVNFFCAAVVVFKYAPMTSWWAILLLVIFLILLIASFLLMCTLEHNSSFDTFQVLFHHFILFNKTE